MTNYYDPTSLQRLLTRRKALTLFGGSAAGAAFLAACGSSTETSSTPSSTTTATSGGDETTTSASADTEAPPETDVPTADELATLDYFGWEGYDTFFGAVDATLIGQMLNASYMASGADIAARYATGAGGGIDILAWTTAELRRVTGVKGPVTPITEAEVPNLANLMDIFQEDPWGHFHDADGNWITIPFTWAPIGITYDQTQATVTSYADLLDPAFTGKIAIPDIPPVPFQVGAIVNGWDPEEVPKDGGIDAILDFVRPIYAQARSIAPTIGDMIGQLASGEAVASFGGWPALGPFTENPDMAFVIPSEGSYSFVDTYSVPEDADNREGALAFINYMLDPEVNAAANGAFVQGTTVKGAVELLDEGNQALYDYANIDALLDANPVVTSPPIETDEFASDAEWLEAYFALTSGG